ncbi:MAG: hypothetical protein MUP76_04285, partial [Acidimicrobiia bacterium]|nr:hypothetical protein [Acidimicrobiia bacterium]
SRRRFGGIMRHPFLLILVSLAVVAAACGEAAESTGEGVTLRYAYQPGDTLAYDTDLQMTIDMTADGDIGIPGGFDMAMDMDISARSTYEISEGPDPATLRLKVSTEFLDGSATADLLGTTEVMPIDELEMPALDVEMVIDAQGSVVEMLVGGETIPLGILESLGGGSTGSLFPGFDSGQLLGPELPDGPVAVGSRWTTELDRDTFGVEVHSRAEHTITATEVVAGRDTYRIETVTTIEEITYTLADLMRALTENVDAIAGLSGDDMSAADLEMAISVLAMMGMEMTFRMDRSVSEGTTWFDAADGVVVRMESVAPQTMFIEMTGIPDTGDFSLDMDMNIVATMRLAE